VAEGYLHRPELTAEKFVADPFREEPRARMYRTGDLARWTEQGQLEFLGRMDFQVKIRGYRIELGEIEARLAQLDGVRDAVVVVHDHGPQDRRLVAYIVPARVPPGATGPAPDPEQLKRRLAEVLPDYMVPTAFVALDALPVTPNGKIDRKALPAPQADAFGTRSTAQPQGPVECAIASLWVELLKHDRIGREDNFFSLGGHSLLAVGLIERMRDEGLHADVRVLFAFPSLSAFAANVTSAPRSIEIPSNRIPGAVRTRDQEALEFTL
jgi:aryl carrier-like protein